MTTDNSLEKTPDLLPEESLPQEKLDKLDSWTNQDCARYYDQIPVKELANFTVVGGFEDGCDVDLAYNQIRSKKKLLDVGAGYGRAIDALLRKGYSGMITALERCEKLYEFMSARYLEDPTVKVVQGDIMTYSFKGTFDAILLMWSNISEFSPPEQPKLLERLASVLDPDGILVIETISPTLEPKNVHTVGKKQSYVAHSKYGTAYGYTPTKSEIIDYLRTINLNLLNTIKYRTKTGRDRILYFASTL